MTIYVKDGGVWRTLDRVYVRDGTSFTNQTINNVYVKHSDEWRNVFVIFETPTTFSTTAGSIAVPALANAIHVQFAVAAGGGGSGGMDYDSRGYEDAGAGGGSGAFISDKVFSVTGGETLTIVTGTGGAGGDPIGDPPGDGTSRSGGNGSAATTVSGTSTGALFSLGVGVGATSNYNSVAVAGTGGSATISGTALTSGTTVDGQNITSYQSGPLGAFNQHGNGASGSGGNRCSGDNCNVGGANGAASYSSQVAGGVGGDAGNGGSYESGQVGKPGTRGSGGGGGGTEQGAPGGAGGDGEISYRFLRIA